MNRPVAVLLAAGGGTRFRGSTHKLLAPLRGKPVFRWAIDHAVAAGCEVWVVTGAADLTAADPTLAGEVLLIHNAAWVSGQAGSLQCAVAEARRRHLDAFTVGLADQPFIAPSTWIAVSSSPAPIAVANYGGTRGNPVRLGSAVWDLLPTEGDAGARNLIAQRPDLVADVPCDGSYADIDTLEDLEQWNS